MIHPRRFRAALAVVALAIFTLPSAGCGLFKRSTDKPPVVMQPASPPAPVATPASPPPARRLAGAQIADENSLKTLVQGKTTKGEVRERFGIPQEVVLGPGIETFIYYRDRTTGWFSRATERVEMLTVRFDSNGILKDFEYRYAGK
jgi:hypothetical protein